ncbi:MAG: RidA family protein [Bacteroidia bacterium]
MKKIIHTPHAPAPIGPYSQAVQVGNTLYVSGQIAIDPDSGSMITNEIQEETAQVMKNIGAILQAAGLSYAHIVKTSIFLNSMDDFAKVNAVYGQYFTADFPARETVEVSVLPKNVNVEISVIAVSDAV